MTLTLAPETEARLQAAAARKGVRPEEVIDILLRQDTAQAVSSAPELPSAQNTPEQERLQSVFLDVIARAQATVPEPYQPKPEQTEEERLFGKIITEKYRKQGFHLP